MNSHDTTGHESGRDYGGAKMGMWLFLLTEALLFFGPVLLYAVFRYRYHAEFAAFSKELDLTVGAVNTVVLISSSLTAAMAVSAMQKGGKNLAAALVVVTVLLGAVFIFNKYGEWDAKIVHGIYPGSAELMVASRGRAVFYGLYYFLTGLHGLHVLVGMTVLGVAAAGVLGDSINRKDHIRLENSVLYWHLVDVVWIFLFPLFYLIA